MRLLSKIIKKANKTSSNKRKLRKALRKPNREIPKPQAAIELQPEAASDILEPLELTRAGLEKEFAGLRPYLQSHVGKKKAKSAVTTLISRMVPLLCITHQTIRHCSLMETETKKWFRELIKCHPTAIHGYITDEIIEKKGRMPSTVLNVLDDLMSMAKWFVLFSGFREARHLGSCLIEGQAFKEVIRSTRKRFKEELTIQRSSPANTIEALVDERKWPAGGLPEAIETVEKEWQEWGKPFLTRLSRIVGDGGTFELSSSDTKRFDISLCGFARLLNAFSRFLQLLLASMYTHSPQARIAGMSDLKLNQADSLVLNGNAQVTLLKTRLQHGYQDVLASELSRVMWESYLTLIRPSIVSHLGDERMKEGNAPLLLRHDGKPMCPHSASRAVSDFFKFATAQNISSNKLRAIMETTGAEAFERGAYKNTYAVLLLNYFLFHIR
jgi:hypothetical protein